MDSLRSICMHAATWSQHRSTTLYRYGILWCKFLPRKRCGLNAWDEKVCKFGWHTLHAFVCFLWPIRSSVYMIRCQFTTMLWLTDLIVWFRPFRSFLTPAWYKQKQWKPAQHYDFYFSESCGLTALRVVHIVRVLLRSQEGAVDLWAHVLVIFGSISISGNVPNCIVQP